MRTNNSISVALKRQLLLPFILLMTISSSHGSDWVYTVRPGDNIWQLSQQYLKNPNQWPEVQKLNNVNNAQAMQPGSRLSIPIAWLKQQPKPAHIISSHGDVTLIKNGKSHSVTPPTAINSGDALQSGADGSATIEFADGSLLILQPSSEIEMDNLGSFDASGMVDTSIRLKKGRVENRVAPQKPDSRYRIITPAAVAAVRGTEFRVGGDDGGKLMRNEVLGGKIAVTGSGVTREVPLGYGTIAESGKPPAIPQPLPAAPDLSSLTKRGSQSSISFDWPVVANAVRYRAQLASDEQFTTVLRDELLETTELIWLDLIPADYILRLRAINKNGLEGFDAHHPFTILAPLAAPRPTTPEDGAALTSAKPWIAWSPVSSANAYQLQLATDAQFTTNLQEIGGIVNSHYRPFDDLPVGHYYWRVASISAGITSEFSPPRQFAISAAPPASGTVTATLKQRDASFTWAAVEAAAEYQFQLGLFEDFTSLTTDTKTTENSFSIKLLAPGHYHYRVRTINGDGRSGAYGPEGVLVVPSSP